MIFLYLHDVKFLKDFMEINFLILSLLIIFTLKIIIMIYVSWSEVSFITEFKENLSNKLFNNFLKNSN